KLFHPVIAACTASFPISQQGFACAGALTRAKMSRATQALPIACKITSVMSASSQLVQIAVGPPVRQAKPTWLRAKAPAGDNFHNLKKLARGLGLHTVCESAQCPNIGECWS